MPSLSLQLAMLFVVAFGCAAWLEPWFQQWAGNSRARTGNVLAVLMGDSRRLFAQHFYLKADAYFHKGYYPSIFDAAPQAEHLHMADATQHGSAETEPEASFLGPPRDWLDRFSRHFYPTEHGHLGEAECDQDDAHHAHQRHPDSAANAGEEREMLPWLRLAADLDPQRPESYVVASYWLRSRLHQVDQAQQFLREGLRHNPQNAEILFELGRIYREHRKDNTRARNLWELSLRQWHKTEAGKQNPNRLLRAQLLGNLATLETEEHHLPRAIAYLQELATFSPNRKRVQQWIAELRAKMAVTPGAPQNKPAP